jgi:predicted methyltransferase
MHVKTRLLALTLCSAALLVSPTVTFADTSREDSADKQIKAAVDHPDRPDRDREEDMFRHPAETMGWLGIEPGMVILDIFTGTGWYAELMARVVGEEGEVQAQNPPMIYERYPQLEDMISTRFGGFTNISRLDQGVGDMVLEPESLDGVMINLVFHDLFWLTEDVPAVVGQLYSALRPGGWVAVIDHAAPAGTGDEYAQGGPGIGIHRIDEGYVRRMFLDAGFVLESENLQFRQPGDDRSKAFFDPEGPGKATDRFALKFRKPDW